MLKMIDETISELLKNTTQETTQKTTQEKLMALMIKNPNITQERLAVELGMTRDGVSYNIRKLKEQGKIERRGSNKSGVWIVK